MHNIILRNCLEFIMEVIRYFSEGKPKDLTEMEKEMKENSDKFLRGIIKAYLEETDRQIAEDKASRRREGLVVERRDEERTVYTRFGEIGFSRSYYYDKQKGTYLHPVDLVAGLEGNERVSPGVSAELVGHAAESSYGESSRHVTGGALSRQTVMKKIRRTHGLKVPVPAKKRVVRALHIDADEDHVTLCNGNKTIVPLITVHEGIEKQSRDRNKCLNAHHLCSYGKKIEDLWYEVADWIEEVYDTEKVEDIYIHGDGASWIKQGLEILVKSKFVLDKYHLNKALMRCTGKQPGYRKILRQAIQTMDQNIFLRAVNKLTKAAGRESKDIKEFRQYVLNNWEGIKVSGTQACGGSSAEGHVSHVLSARLSSRPMGWSREGLKHMTELRAFHVNGGVVGVEHLRKPQKTAPKLIERAVERTCTVFQGISLENLGNIASLNMGKVTPLFRIMRSVQHGGLIIG